MAEFGRLCHSRTHVNHIPLVFIVDLIRDGIPCRELDCGSGPRRRARRAAVRHGKSGGMAFQYTVVLVGLGSGMNSVEPSTITKYPGKSPVPVGCHSNASPAFQ